MYCNTIGKDIYIIQDIDDLVTMGFDISHTFDTPFICTKREFVKWYYPLVKRSMDFLCSGIALVILLLILLIVAVAIKFYDGRLVFYEQVSLTQGHREIYIYKFRSMIMDVEKNGARLVSQKG